VARGSFETVVSATRLEPVAVRDFLLTLEGTHYLCVSLISDTPATFSLLRQSTAAKEPYHCSDAKLLTIILVLSIIRCDHRAIQFLHSVGVDLNTPLNYDDRLRELYQRLNINVTRGIWTPLTFAVTSGDAKGVHLLLRLGANVNGPGKEYQCANHLYLRLLRATLVMRRGTFYQC
jgi:hypothetical protein